MSRWFTSALSVCMNALGRGAVTKEVDEVAAAVAEDSESETSSPSSQGLACPPTECIESGSAASTPESSPSAPPAAEEQGADEAAETDAAESEPCPVAAEILELDGELKAAAEEYSRCKEEAKMLRLQMGALELELSDCC